MTYMACCKCCCGGIDCDEGQPGKCCCGGYTGACCQEGEYCCGGSCEPDPCVACEEEVEYSYDGPLFENPGVSTANSDATCTGDGDNCGQSVSGYMRSSDFPKWCVGDLVAKATVRAGATIDNIGNIAGLTFASNGSSCPAYLEILENDETVEAEVVEVDSSTVYFRVPYYAENDDSCGPYGVMTATIYWFLEPADP